MKAILKKYSWPILAVILLIIFLLCNWMGDDEGDSPGRTELPPTPDLCYEKDSYAHGKDGQDIDEKYSHRFYFKPAMCPFEYGDPNARIEFERYWSPYVGGGGCPTPCWGNGVQWRVYDSEGTLVFSIDDMYPVNTFGSPDILQGAYDGSKWKVELINECGCMISQDWELNINADGV